MNLIDSVAGWLGYAKKSEMPTAEQLMAGTGGISTYPMTFPGWDKLTKPDERKTAETAMSSAWASSAVQTIMREFSTADLNVFKKIDGDDLKISDHSSANLLFIGPQIGHTNASALVFQNRVVSIPFSTNVFW